MNICLLAVCGINGGKDKYYYKQQTLNRLAYLANMKIFICYQDVKISVSHLYYEMLDS